VVNAESNTGLKVNGRAYKLPAKPTVVVCVDGCEPDYLAQAVATGQMPWLKRTLALGSGLTGDCVVPSFTNPNNLSIVTGAPPSVHGICGNYLFDTASGTEVMMNDPKWLRAPTLLAALSDAGQSLAVVTAKDKLRKLLGHKMKGICFSSEKADQVTLEENGIADVLGLVGQPLPERLQRRPVGVRVRRRREDHAKYKPDVMYLSTTDYVQHKHAPGTDGANAFYAHDGRLHAAARRPGLRDRAHGRPRHERQGRHGRHARRDLPAGLVRRLAGRRQGARDPADHRPLCGAPRRAGFLRHGLPAGGHQHRGRARSRGCGARAWNWCWTREQAAERFELPADRIGDIVCVSERFTVIGTSASRHDLSALEVPLRSHGGMSEQRVPLIVNRKLPGLDRSRRFRNFDAFDLANHQLRPISASPP
jgi:phosphonoacetate hydrolase